MMPARTYSIETERLLIRCYHPADAELVKQAVDQSLDYIFSLGCPGQTMILNR